jgi:Zn-dependent peptidase ImmA (M78 family)
MNAQPDPLAPAEIGERLRLAREAARVTQAAAAAALSVARTTIVAIEQGQRRPRVDELQQLAALYGVSLNGLLRREAVQVDLRPRFRKAGEQDADVEAAAGLLTSLVQSEVELENLLGVQRARNDPPERPLLPGDVTRQAEQGAFELRQWLGLGLAPVHDMTALLELQLGARVFVRRLPPKISGLYAFDEASGACILLNASHRRDRRAQTAAHELGHFVSTRRAPDALQDGSPESSREERYAHAFGRAFMTPARAVMAKFQDVTAGAKQLTRRHVIVLAHTFGVSREAIVRRLEELQLTKAGTWDWFVENGNITDEQARLVLGESALSDADQSDANRLVSIRLNSLASEAWRRGLLSEGQIARLLHLDRVDARELIDEYERDLAPDPAPVRRLV